MKKGVTLWNLNEENIYIKLKEGTINKIFNYAQENRIPDKRINYRFHYKKRKFLPLDLIKKIIKSIPNNKKGDMKKEIEGLKEIKFGRGKAKSIKKPNLPIKKTRILGRITGHLIGDGGIRNYKGDSTIHYTNKDYFLINQFEKDIIKLLGDVKSYKYKYNIKNKNIDLKTIRFPSIAGVLLTELVGPMIKQDKQVPSIIINSNKTTKKLFLQALFDDEGCISSNRICFVIKNKEIITKVKEILEEFKIKTSKIAKNKKTGTHRLDIYGKENIALFARRIGFNQKNKRKKLKKYIENNKYKQNRYQKGQIRGLILNIIKKERHINRYNLGKILSRNSNAIRQHLYKLEDNGEIESRTRNKTKIYSLKK